ncbi:cupin domain-containing protein [Bacillus sp. UNCCL13]|nr:cupin domain-containing protein [Bacillus sp. UNCCL13]
MHYKTIMFKDDGEIPNNPKLPVIVYEGVMEENPNEIEATFNRHNWLGSWSGDVFDYHHYHSNSHEVLGVKAGKATVLIGGEEGDRLELNKGDVILLPAGTGHKKLESSDDFVIVGAYPNGNGYNLRKRDPGVRAQSLGEIRSVPLPDLDPVYGDSGPMQHVWK